MLVPVESLTNAGIQRLVAKGYVVEIKADEGYADIHKEEGNEPARSSEVG